MSKRKTNTTASQILPYELTGTDFRLRLTGRFGDGGLVEFLHDDAVFGFVILPPVEWAILALLAQAGIDSTLTGWLAGFVKTEKLAKELYLRELISDQDPDLIIKTVHRLRRRLSTAKPVSDLKTKSFGKRLIETQRFLGYRISLPPDQLELKLLEDG